MKDRIDEIIEVMRCREEDKLTDCQLLDMIEEIVYRD